jgi:hypothetical protein
MSVIGSILTIAGGFYLFINPAPAILIALVGIILCRIAEK